MQPVGRTKVFALVAGCCIAWLAGCSTPDEAPPSADTAMTAVPSVAASDTSKPPELGRASTDAEMTTPAALEDISPQTAPSAAGRESITAPPDVPVQSSSAAESSSAAQSPTSASGPPPAASTAVISNICSLISPSDVTTAIGAGNFDSASDISIGSTRACLYTTATGSYGLTITAESVKTYLGGDLANLAPTAAIATMVTAQSLSLDDVTTSDESVAGFPATRFAGTSAVTAVAVGYAVTVVNGVAITVSADGAELSSAPTTLGSYALAALRVIVGKLA
ncbi:hypothetical protein EH165_03265 [Nakamurella antarctica]|uniref:DUF3558 domain-containing protein n=1 Tax=Nakamurella antarctica TaxID=1902245 RepID=A0A3G8ZS33_9ACTN|nr:hypothetical protein [Nakamurella antarctica]AZI57324.1 hypothetical protein EH165_03265 [Nakamurella antarctica]